MKKRLAVICLVGALGMSAFTGVTQVYAENGIVINTNHTSVNIPEKYIYQLTEEEQSVLEQAKAAGGQQAAELLNTLNNDMAFETAVEKLLDMYFADDNNISEKYETFKTNIDARAIQIISDYESAHDERMMADKLYYYEDMIMVRFDADVENEDIEQAVGYLSESGKIVFDPVALISEGTSSENVSEVMEKTNKMAIVKIRKGQTVDNAISLYSQLDGVKNAERISRYVTCDRMLGYKDETEYNIECGKTVDIDYYLNRIETTDIVWMSSQPDVVSVNQNGQITGHKEGTANIIVTYAPEQPEAEALSLTFTVNVQGEKKSLDIKSKIYKTSDRVKYKNKIITSYSQMKKVIKEYKSSKNYNVKIYKKMLTYDKTYFKRGSLILHSVVLKKGQNLKVISAQSVSDDNGKTNIDINTRITGKTNSTKAAVKVQCFVELSKTYAKKCDNLRFN